MSILLFNLAIIFAAVVLTLILAAAVSRPGHLAAGAYRDAARGGNAMEPSGQMTMCELSPDQMAPPIHVVAAGMQ